MKLLIIITIVFFGFVSTSLISDPLLGLIAKIDPDLKTAYEIGKADCNNFINDQATKLGSREDAFQAGQALQGSNYGGPYGPFKSIIDFDNPLRNQFKAGFGKCLEETEFALKEYGFNICLKLQPSLYWKARGNHPLLARNFDRITEEFKEPTRTGFYQCCNSGVYFYSRQIQGKDAENLLKRYGYKDVNISKEILEKYDELHTRDYTSRG